MSFFLQTKFERASLQNHPAILRLDIVTAGSHVHGISWPCLHGRQFILGVMQRQTRFSLWSVFLSCSRRYIRRLHCSSRCNLLLMAVWNPSQPLNLPNPFCRSYRSLRRPQPHCRGWIAPAMAVFCLPDFSLCFLKKPLSPFLLLLAQKHSSPAPVKTQLKGSIGSDEAFWWATQSAKTHSDRSKKP